MAEDAPVVDAKLQLRASMKARRAAIPTVLRAERSLQVAERGLSWLTPSPLPQAIISGFLAIGDELDTAPLLVALHHRGHPLCLPVMQGRDKPLLFRTYAPGDALATAVWGIREPFPEKAALEPDILLVPLLAADLQGHRLGYGGGFFDRTLTVLRQKKPVIAIGLAFEEQVVDAVPHLDYDERLDWVLTPTGPRRTKR